MTDEKREPSLVELRRVIKESRKASQARHGSACPCWLCRGN